MSSGPVVVALAAGLFCSAMLHVIVTDLRERRISNRTVAALGVLWIPVALAAGMPAGDMAGAAGAAALVFAAGLACFAAGWVGGGDVKLAAAAVLWLGPGQAVPFLLLASLIGGVIALGAVAAAWRAGSVARPVPYGPALALAGLALLSGSPWAAAL